MKAKLMRLLTDEEGQGMVEYGIIICLISIAAITAFVLIGPKLLGIFNTANGALPAPPAAP